MNPRAENTSFADWCVVNVSVGQWYPTAQSRMVASLRAHGYRGETLLWRDALPPGCPAHETTPYAFKPWAIQHARAKGFQRVAWLDSSIVAADRVFDCWFQAARAGTPFQGSHRNDRGQVSADPRVLGHRHDQIVLSAAVWREGCPTYQWADAITQHTKRYRFREHSVFLCRRKCYGFETQGRVGTPLWRLLYHPRNALRRLLGRN